MFNIIVTTNCTVTFTWVEAICSSRDLPVAEALQQR